MLSPSTGILSTQQSQSWPYLITSWDKHIWDLFLICFLVGWLKGILAEVMSWLCELFQNGYKCCCWSHLQIHYCSRNNFIYSSVSFRMLTKHISLRKSCILFQSDYSKNIIQGYMKEKPSPIHNSFSFKIWKKSCLIFLSFLCFAVYKWCF